MEIINHLSKDKIKELSFFLKEVNDNILSSSMFCSNRQKIIFEELMTCNDNNKLVVAIDNQNFVGACFIYFNGTNADVNLLISYKYYSKYDDIALMLFSKIKNVVPINTKFTFYFPKQNTLYASFLRKINAVKHVNEYCLLLKKENVQNTIHCDLIEEMSENDYDDFIDLLKEVFPDCYVTGEEIINDPNREVYVLKENDQLNAFGVLNKKSDKKYCTEIIIVREGYRHNCRGRKILSYLIEKAFSRIEVEEIDLIVDCDNESALRLYFDLGFSIEYENNNYSIINKG